MFDKYMVPSLYFYILKWWIKHGFIASLTTLVYDIHIKFHYIDNNLWIEQTNIVGKHLKKRGGYNSQRAVVILITIKTNKYVNKR